MQPTTDRPDRDTLRGPSNQYLFALTLIAVSVITLIVAAGLNYATGAWTFIFYPFSYASDKMVTDSMAEYSGNTPALVSLREMVLVISGIFFSLILVPTLFLLGVRDRLLSPGSKKFPPVLWLAATAIAGGLFLSTTVSFFFQQRVFEELRQRQSVQYTKDLLIDQISGISVRAREYCILPTSLQGGGGSLDGFTIPTEYVSSPTTVYSLDQSESGSTIRAMVYANPMVQRMTATRLDSPVGTVSAGIDSTGKLRGWGYTGVFE